MKKMDEREAQVVAKACQWALAAMYLVLIPSVIVKAFLLSLPADRFVTEALALILGGVAMMVRSGSQGVFDTGMEFNTKNCLLASIIPSALVTVLICIGLANKYEQFQGDWAAWNLFLAGSAVFLFAFMGSLLLFIVYGAWSKHRARKIDQELEDLEEKE